MRLFPLLVLALLAGIAAPARAAWEYTRWGMSPADVVTASHGRVQLAAPSRDTNSVFGSTGAKGTFSQANPPFTFDAYFLFRYDKLTQVSLHPQGKVDCTPIANKLIVRLGPPAIRSLDAGITSFFWSNAPGATDIWLLRLPETCQINYFQHGVVPARSPEGRGRPEDLAGRGPSQQKPAKAPPSGGKDRTGPARTAPPSHP